MTPDQTFQLILGFISSLVSGAVAGLIAGLVVLQSQFSRQLALDDETKLLDMLHLLEKISSNINDAIAMRKLDKEYFPESFDEAKSDREIMSARWEGERQLNSLLTKAEYLRSKKYEIIKRYFKIKLNANRLTSDDSEQMIKNIQEFMADIEDYIYHHYGFANRLRLIWQATRAFVTHNTLTAEGKTLLAEAANIKGELSQLETVGFISLDVKSLHEMLNTPVGFRTVDISGSGPGKGIIYQNNRKAPYIAALKQLKQLSLIRQISSETKPSVLGGEITYQVTRTDYTLTRDGWWAGLKYAKKYTLPSEIGPKQSERPLL